MNFYVVTDIYCTLSVVDLINAAKGGGRARVISAILPISAAEFSAMDGRTEIRSVNRVKRIQSE